MGHHYIAPDKNRARHKRDEKHSSYSKDELIANKYCYTSFVNLKNAFLLGLRTIDSSAAQKLYLGLTTVLPLIASGLCEPFCYACRIQNAAGPLARCKTALKNCRNEDQLQKFNRCFVEQNQACKSDCALCALFFASSCTLIRYHERWSTTVATAKQSKPCFIKRTA